MFKSFLFLLLLPITTNAAINDWTDKVKINHIETHSKNKETVVPHRSAETWVFPRESLSWRVSPGCKTDAVIIAPEDNNLISLALTAISTQYDVVFYVDVENKNGDGYCFLRSMSLVRE